MTLNLLSHAHMPRVSQIAFIIVSFCMVNHSLCQQLNDVLYLTQAVVITTPNGSINLPIGSSVRVVAANGEIVRVSPDGGGTIVDLARSAMTTEQPRQEKQQSQKTDSANEAQVYITGYVLSVTADGVLLRDATIGVRVLENVVTGRNPLDGRPWEYAKRWVTKSKRSEEPIFLYGLKGLVDGQKVEGVSYKAENYQYTATNGAVKTVLGFRNR
jgi:hypothetical protein